MFKKIFFAFACAATLTACNENFEDWAKPQTNDEPTTVSFGNGSVSEVGVIDMANLLDGQSTVKVCNITAPTASKEGYDATYKLNLGNQSYDIAIDGEMSVADFTKYLSDNGILRPIEYAIPSTVEMWLSNGVSSIKTATSSEFNVKVKPQAPVIEDTYYITGTPNGWNNADMTYALTNGGGDVYANPVFTVTLPAGDGNVEFKVTPASGIGGDWSKCLCASDVEGQFVMNNAGGNFVIPAVAGAAFYKITFNMMELTWSYEALAGYETWYLVGSDIADGSWNNSVGGIGSAIIPLGVKSVQESNVLVWTGYLAGNGFKLIKTPGNWDDQWGQVGDHFEKNNGGSGNITVAAGYYTVTLDIASDKLTVEPYSGSPAPYSSMGIAGTINGWSFDAMNACAAANNHDWYCDVTVEGNGEVKFGANCDWGTNWGAADFPYGVGVNNGANILVSGGSYVVVFNDITGAYTFVKK